tara:strand:- start:2469 stop:2732 length:264 start_codon:yes stop_codon:yes gene_type:complete
VIDPITIKVLNKNLNMLENTKNLFAQLKDKQSFIMLCSTEFEIKPLSIRNNWFGGYWAIPDKHLKRVVDLLQNSIVKQNLLKQVSCI